MIGDRIYSLGAKTGLWSTITFGALPKLSNKYDKVFEKGTEIGVVQSEGANWLKITITAPYYKWYYSPFPMRLQVSTGYLFKDQVEIKTTPLVATSKNKLYAKVDLNVRNSPTTNSSIRYVANAGDFLGIATSETKNGFSKISSINGGAAWVKSNLASKTPIVVVINEKNSNEKNSNETIEEKPKSNINDKLRTGVGIALLATIFYFIFKKKK